MPKIAAMRETFGRILDYGGVAGVEGEIATVADVFALLQAYKQDPADGLYGLHMTNRTVAWYEANAEVLAPQYESLPPQRTLAWLGHLLPPAPAVVLDVGAGTGRDAAFLAASGYDVLALEPAASMRAVGARLHNHARLRWLPDTLPSLAAVSRSGLSADMILLSRRLAARGTGRPSQRVPQARDVKVWRSRSASRPMTAWAGRYKLDEACNPGRDAGKKVFHFGRLQRLKAWSRSLRPRVGQPA